MYKIITIGFDGDTTLQAQSESKDSIRRIYENIIKHCLYGFPNIAEVKIIDENGETVTSFINWRR